MTNDRDRVHVFLFGTRLTNITRQLRHRDPEVAFQMVSHVVPDWSGGTRIGEALEAFNRLWARRVLGQGAVVLLITDGLDRDGAQGPGGEHGSAASLLPAADLAQSAVALGGVRAKITGHPRDAAARGRVPPRAQPGQPARAGRSAVPPGAAAIAVGTCRRTRKDGVMSIAETEDVLGTAAAWRAAGEQVAVATVTETWGSSPRPAGSQMAVTKSGKMAGSVSGGCIEGAVADAAMKTIETGTPQLLDFGVTQRARLGGRPGLRRQGEGVRGEAVVTGTPTAAPALRTPTPTLPGCRGRGGAELPLPRSGGSGWGGSASQ